tara:strand:- start:314 stop:586 length:273 start_codon:yes stop_codon:yes gene_type:complete
MNIFILKAIRYLDNPELFTDEEMWENASAANYTDNDTAAAYTTYAVATHAANFAYSPTLYSPTLCYWLDEYFIITGEDKQDYINEVERLR